MRMLPHRVLKAAHFPVLESPVSNSCQEDGRDAQLMHRSRRAGGHPRALPECGRKPVVYEKRKEYAMGHSHWQCH